MSIIRVHKHERYVMIEKTGLEDPRLSFKAKGMLAYLLSKPDDWTVNYRGLMKVGPDGQRAVVGALKELEKAGYLRRRRKHIAGRYTWEQVIYEAPNNADGLHALKMNAFKTSALTEEGSTDIRAREKTNPYTICGDCGCAVPDRDLEEHQQSHGATG